MNKSDVLTAEKIMLPLRLSPDIYNKVRKTVNDKKNKERGYSINQYLTELITRDLEEKNNG